MSTWPRVRVDQCAEVVSGATPDTSDSSYWDGDICWATPKDLSELEGAYIADTPRKITRRGLESCATSVLPPESVLFSSRAPIGHVAINTVPMATNQGFKSFVPDRRSLHPKFLYHWLRKNRPYLESLGNGATFKEVSKAVISRIEIPLPPLPEQRRIAEILDKADALRAKRRTAIAQLNTLTQSVFLDMFGLPIGGESKWALKPLGEACEKITDGTHHSPPIKSEGIPYVTAKHLKEEGLDFFSDPWFVSQEDHRAIFSRCDPRPGDVLYIKDGATTGIAAVNRYDFEFSMLSSLALLRPKPGVLTAEYLCHWLNNAPVRRWILGGMAGAAIRRLTLAKIKAIRIPLPPLRQQQAFALGIARAYQLRGAYRAELSELESLFASMQNRAFLGEL